MHGPPPHVSGSASCGTGLIIRVLWGGASSWWRTVNNRLACDELHRFLRQTVLLFYAAYIFSLSFHCFHSLQQRGMLGERVGLAL
jgi:hypothetical protein